MTRSRSPWLAVLVVLSALATLLPAASVQAQVPEVPSNVNCDPLDPKMCLFPFPNDFFTVPDAFDGYRPEGQLRPRCHAPQRRGRNDRRRGQADRPDRVEPQRRLLAGLDGHDLRPRHRPACDVGHARAVRTALPARTRSVTSTTATRSPTPRCRWHQTLRW